MLNLTVHGVDAEKGLLLIKGAIPGPTGGLVLVRNAVKRRCRRRTALPRRRCVSMADRRRPRPPTASTDGTVELPGRRSSTSRPNIPLMHQVVVAQQAAARQGTHDTKTRGEVRGGGKKPYRQKGTGRARQGSTRAPQFAGGGVVHGPTPRDYAQRTPKKMKAAALRGALSDRARDGRVHVVAVLRATATRRRPGPRWPRCAAVTERPQGARGAADRGRRGRLARACATSPRCT